MLDQKALQSAVRLRPSQAVNASEPPDARRGQYTESCSQVAYVFYSSGFSCYIKIMLFLLLTIKR
jgi:hypothetical protein